MKLIKVQVEPWTPQYTGPVIRLAGRYVRIWSHWADVLTWNQVKSGRTRQVRLLVCAVVRSVQRPHGRCHVHRMAYWIATSLDRHQDVTIQLNVLHYLSLLSTMKSLSILLVLIVVMALFCSTYIVANNQDNESGGDDAAKPLDPDDKDRYAQQRPCYLADLPDPDGWYYA